ncbi:MAG: universal stress protein [Cyclobacteriaceae bacterium]|nr:universal stress protein [Cyclobacteriaceae bacterium]
MKKILVPTDFTPTAENAVEVARMLAKKNGAEIIFLNVIEINSGESINTSGGPSNYASFTDGILIHETIKKSEQEMTRLTEVSKFQGVNSSYEIKLGNPFGHIFSAIDEHNIDFIVMGTKGASGLSEILIGSNAEKVVRKAKCPVLAIKEALNENTFKDVVYATNFGANEDGVVAAIKEIQSIFNSKVHLVWINTPNDFKSDATTRPLLDKFVADHGLKNCTTHVYSDIIAEDGIRNFAEYISAGLIVMGTNSYTGLSRLIRGSVAEDMVNHAVRPVLTVSMKE